MAQGNILETDNPGYYNVTATDANGCEIESNFILIEELPLPNFNDILGNTEIGVNENSVYYTQPNEDSTFEWIIENNDGEIISGQGIKPIEISWQK